VVEELRGKKDECVIMTFDIGQIKHHIGALSDDLLGPGSGLETVNGMLIPDKLALACLCVASGSKVILATITVNINPNTHVVEEARLVWGYLIKCLLALRVSQLKDIDVTISFARGQEPVRYHDGVFSGKNVTGNHSDAIGPLECTG
jgi:hypothetical protein